MDYYEPTIENSKSEFIKYDVFVFAEVAHLIEKNESKISNFKVFYYFNPDILLTAFNKTVNINGHHYDLHVVDTAGQDEYTIFPAEYSVDVNGYVLVYSIDSMHSFEVCKNIHEKLMDLVGIRKYE